MRDLRRKFERSCARCFTVAAGLACVCLAGISPAKAQVATASQEPASNWRLLTKNEGRAIVNSAWEQDQPARGTQDCSHLVHQIYLKAGYEYPYASSFDIYAGSENFARVRYPQPGDLIAWPGHVGIVVDPLQHSFYSLVSTGLEAQDYRAPYWRSRGRPRFYRYKVEDENIVSNAKTPAPSRTLSPALQHGSAADVEGQSAAENSDPNRPPKATSQRVAVVYGPKAPAMVDAPVTTTEVPASILIATGNKLPTREEVAQGISELCNGAGNVLRASGPSKLQTPLVIFDRLKVERVEIKRDHGWARVQLETRVALASGGTDTKRRSEKVRWELRRTELGWEAIRPSDRTYVPHDVAVRNLAEQLARLTGSDEAAAHQEKVLRQESQLVSLLSVLLENK